MLQHFQEDARQVVIQAQNEAREMPCSYIGSEHLLLGLLREGKGPAAQVLGGRGLTLETVREKTIALIEEHLGKGYNSQLSYSPRAKKVLELGLREAISLGHNYIGTEHILLGLIREGEGVAIRVLGELDVDPEHLRDDLIDLLGRGGQHLIGKGGRTPSAPVPLKPAPPATPEPTGKTAVILPDEEWELIARWIEGFLGPPELHDHPLQALYAQLKPAE